jgi:hypothetical protein
MKNKSLVTVALLYDFDGTLAKGNMQEYDFMEKLNIKPDVFWAKSDTLALEQNADNNLAYMRIMLEEAQKIGKTREDFIACGQNIRFFEGVLDWFDRINAYGKKLGINVEHYLLSSGLSEIVEGCPIYKKFKKIYACRFMYNEKNEAYWPAQVVNYTTKTQYLYRISKGCLEESDKSVNNRTTAEDRVIPFSRMVYIGDGLTDVPCMATLKKFGGHALAVYTPRTKNNKKNANRLLEDGRVDTIAPANYTEGSTLDVYIKSLLKKIKADYDFNKVL